MGRNGIPYSAYKAHIDIASEVFAKHCIYMSTETCPDDISSSNQQLVWFALKGVMDTFGFFWLQYGGIPFVQDELSVAIITPGKKLPNLVEFINQKLSLV